MQEIKLTGCCVGSGLQLIWASTVQIIARKSLRCVMPEMLRMAAVLVRVVTMLRAVMVE